MGRKSGKTSDDARCRTIRPGALQRGLSVIFALLMIVVGIADYLVLGVYASSVDKLFVATADDEEAVAEATAAGLETALSIEEEGIVLLENNGSLPLSVENLKVNLLGYRAYDSVYGGTGSGGTSYMENRVSLKEALSDAGIEVNPVLEELYAEYAGNGNNTYDVDFAINEPAADEALAADMGQEYVYTDEASFEALAEYSDIALIVFARAGGEGNDLPTDMTEYTDYGPDQSRHYLELNSAEESLLEAAKAAFATVIVIFNSSNAMELGFLEDGEDGEGETGDVDGALWIGDPGDVGFTAVAEVLTGAVNPSGRLADIYPYAVETIPSYYNFAEYTFTNTEGLFDRTSGEPQYVYLLEYQEGIYIGYKYYETREEYSYTTREGEEMSGLTYEEVVQYPFGYGLSYTSFEWTVLSEEDGAVLTQAGQVTITVEVTNTGDTAGKDVVEIYYEAPYYSTTDGGSGIQKAARNLIAYVKTSSLEPGESETLTLTVDVGDLASYDENGVYSTNGSYVLEAGTYTLYVGSDSHTAAAQFSFMLEETYVFAEEESAVSAGSAGGTGDNALPQNPSADIVYVGKRSSDEVTAVNQFGDVSGDIEYLNRDTWEITEGSSREATEEELKAFCNAQVIDTSTYENTADEEPLLDQDYGSSTLELEDMAGLDYDDEAWEQLLNQLSLRNMMAILGTNGWGASSVSNISMPQIADMDGPSGITYALDVYTGTSTYETVLYPCEVVLASTWNTQLAAQYGASVAAEGAAWGVSGWYAPGANMHRNPFSGRNFEYYSEDPILSGTICAAVVSAAWENGMYTYVKHFVLNEMETNRHYGLCTFASEQALRECYLVPFEYAVKEGGTPAIMSSYNNLGTTWAGASSALLTSVLRNEWGFIGVVLTDNYEDKGFMDPEKAILAGGTTLLNNGSISVTFDTLRSSASGLQLMREACHQYLYMVANSNVFSTSQSAVPWRRIVIAASAALELLFAAGIVMNIRRLRRGGRDGKE